MKVSIVIQSLSKFWNVDGDLTKMSSSTGMAPPGPKNGHGGSNGLCKNLENIGQLTKKDDKLKVCRLDRKIDKPLRRREKWRHVD